jgi:mRNA-degrading endonuclease YafQ of YafQ-DinJ toxin-antitoxin module
MHIEYTRDFIRTRKRITKKHTLSHKAIDNAITLYIENKTDPKLQFKKIQCKRDKNRHSIRIPNTQYRILMSVIKDLTVLQCICDHDEYNMRNKKC